MKKTTIISLLLLCATMGIDVVSGSDFFPENESRTGSCISEYID